MATDLYIAPNGSDSNPGTQAAPFQTILAASQHALPGTTVHVAPGTYQGGFITTASGTAAAPIHFVSDTKWGAIIVPAVSSTYDMAWDNRGAFVTIDGFQVDGSQYQGGTMWRLGLYTSGSNSVLQNNNVHHISTTVDPGDPGGAGIEGDSYYGGTNINLIGNVVHDIGPANATTVHGVYDTVPGLVADNLVYSASGWGIQTSRTAHDIAIVNNTIFHNGTGGIVVAASVAPADNMFVANNIVFDNANYGIVESGLTGTHNTYTNNLVYQDGTNWRLQNGLTDSQTIATDPKFVSYVRTGGGDYHLASGSAAIDTGTASHAPSTDLDGSARPQGAGFDIGAYEFVSAPPPPPGSDLYVSTSGSDANPGTQAAPFRTILAASQHAQPGATVHVAPGTYNGGFVTTASGTSTGPIHYVSDTKWGAIIAPPANSSYDTAWDNRGSYVIIDGFQVDGSSLQGGTPWRFGIYSAGAYSVIENNNVHHISTSVDPGSAGGAGIEGDGYYGATNIDVIGNIVHDVGPASSHTVQGIYETTPGNVMDNLVYGASAWGIQTWQNAHDVNIVNNTIFHNGSGGIVVAGNVVPADNMSVANNIVYDNANFGIIESGNTGTHNTYTNNLVNQDGTNWRLQNGLVDSGTVVADPRFVNYISTGGGNYHLASGSPAIDAGTASHAPATDLDGTLRPHGAGFDIGAYEFV